MSGRTSKYLTLREMPMLNQMPLRKDSALRGSTRLLTGPNQIPSLRRWRRDAGGEGTNSLMAPSLLSTGQAEAYEFAGFSLSVAEHTLRKGDEIISLPPKVFDLLLILVQNSGREIRKSELMHLIWPDSIVEESNLTQSIFLLRKSLGQKESSNPLIVTIPGRGYRFTCDVKSCHRGSRAQTSLCHFDASIRSLAVFPFRVIGNPGDESLLSVGIADALITRLSTFRRITVRPTSAILKFSPTSHDPYITGQELGVDAVLNGTLQHVQGKIRVTVQLARVSDGYLFWADKFDGDFMDVFTVQESISEWAGNALAVKLANRDRDRLAKRYTDNQLAYRSYLKGRFHADRWTRQGTEKAIDHFTAAIALDPQYALAYAGLADVHYVRAGLYDDPHEIMPRAKRAAYKALELDDSLGEAHTSLALILGFFDWDWQAADREFGRALELNPGHARTYLWHGRHLAAVSRFDESLAQLQRSQELDPLSPLISTELGRTYYVARRFDLAIRQLQETLDLEPNFWPAHMFLGCSYAQQGLYQEATTMLLQASTLDSNPHTLGCLGYVYAISGKKTEARRILRQIAEGAKERYVSPYHLAGIHAGLGELNDAYTLLEKACTQRSEWPEWLGVDPKFDSVRADVRFTDLVRHVLS
jgi:DNA-binding winged helix-turn-helix (wHTH) protein/tetratricopeptide (TPR) repeat protein